MSDNDTDAKYPELVAYLDGELSADDRAQVEERLSSDKEYRGELAELQRTWDLLDALPPVVATESFTQSTIEMVALRASDNSSPKRASQFQWFKFIAIVLVVSMPVAAFCYGYWDKQNELNSDNRQTLNDIPIYENLELYRSVNAELDVEGAIQFLELLSKTETVFYDFDESETDGNSENEAKFQIDGRVDLEAAMDDEKMQDLLYKQRQFEDLESGGGGEFQAKNLRNFHQKIKEHPESSALLKSLRKFREWLRNKGYRGQDVIDTIMDLAPAERVAEIKRMEEKDFEDRYSRSFSTDIPAISPSPKDVALINRIARERANSFMVRVFEHIMHNSTPERISEIEAKLDAAPTQHHYRAILMMEARGSGRISPPTISNEENIKEIIAGLSGESKEKLSWLSEDSQVEVVQTWIGIALFRVKDSDLFEFYDNGLNGKQRNSLKLVDAPKRKELLIKAFRQTLFQRPIPAEDLSELLNSRSRSRRDKERDEAKNDETNDN